MYCSVAPIHVLCTAINTLNLSSHPNTHSRIQSLVYKTLHHNSDNGKSLQVHFLEPFGFSTELRGTISSFMKTTRHSLISLILAFTLCSLTKKQTSLRYINKADL